MCFSSILSVAFVPISPIQNNVTLFEQSSINKTQIIFFQAVMRCVTMVDTFLVPLAVVGPLIMDSAVSIVSV